MVSGRIRVPEHTRYLEAHILNPGDPTGPPYVSLGLSWKWPGGNSDGLPALWELLHEMGHGIHLILSCCDRELPPDEAMIKPTTSSPEDVNELGLSSTDGAHSASRLYKHFCGLHLPLDLLEVPSMLMEKLAMDPIFLQVMDRSRKEEDWREPIIRSVSYRAFMHTYPLHLF